MIENKDSVFTLISQLFLYYFLRIKDNLFKEFYPQTDNLKKYQSRTMKLYPKAINNYKLNK